MADIREMRIGERETISYDFAPDLAANEYFSSANIICANGLSANGSPAIGGNNNTQISQAFTVAANTADGYYTLTFTGTTDGGNIKKKVYLIRVVADVSPAAANANIALVRLDEAKSYVGKTTDEDTAVLERIVDSVSQQFNRYTGRTLASATYTNQTYDGDGMHWLYLKNYPITANLAVVEDDIALVAGNNNDYLPYNDEGRLYRVDDVWYFGPRTIQVTYTAGYNCTSGNITLPYDLRLAALSQIAYEFNRYQRKDWGMDSVSYPDGSRSMMQEGLLKDVKAILDGYKRYTI